VLEPADMDDLALLGPDIERLDPLFVAPVHPARGRDRDETHRRARRVEAERPEIAAREQVIRLDVEQRREEASTRLAFEGAIPRGAEVPLRAGAGELHGAAFAG